jgi:hypothetical protein
VLPRIAPLVAMTKAVNAEPTKAAMTSIMAGSGVKSV